MTKEPGRVKPRRAKSGKVRIREKEKTEMKLR